MHPAPEPTATLGQALAHAERLLHTDPRAAREQAAEILRNIPQEPRATLLLGIAERSLGFTARAVAILQALAAAQPRAPAVWHELGLALAEGGERDRAIAAWRRAVALQADLPDTWRALAAALREAGEAADAAAADAEQVRAATRDPRLLAAGAALCRNDIPQAETLLRDHLRQHPEDVAAIRMFAEVAGRLGRYHDAESLLLRALELAPAFHAARYDYAVVLNRQGRPAAAIDEVQKLLALEPRNAGYRNLQAVILARIGDYAESIRIYAELLAAHPHQTRIWLSYGHALAAAGDDRASIAAYRQAIGREPRSGEAYWSLANLKTFRFSDEDREAMAAQLACTDLSDEERIHFSFAAGKAAEDGQSYELAFGHYATGNRLRRAQVFYDPDETQRQVEAARRVLTPEFFAARAAFGCVSPGPIFIVGLPRAGSTLIEQILASHPAVEGTAELPDIISIARALTARSGPRPSAIYPEVLAGLGPEECAALGAEYLQRTRIQRRSLKPLFIDKMPNNFLHIGLIRLILPAARIIDARRAALACCFSAYKQYFANGQNYSYDLGELGAYYRSYVALMHHFEAALPGVVHRVEHERLIDDTEGEVRALLDYCGLPFDAACLRFYENRRAVRTASSQQVRRPISRDGLHQWRHFESWLGPLRTALGPELAADFHSESF
jgi:predicted Zn-dependent protease